ncbi:AAA family ATPase [Geodermatophilus marinus]|uniref:AAA family ATPase n=1 Tax=Geodermatophilus sp. LHW52908 TaxID=2303986 RepID=UPI001314CDD0|nr:AAA family ATPase [Geodermatophilus sp. LHW52908]
MLDEEGDRDLFLIDGILHSGLTLLYGESEIGKSYLVVSVTGAVCQGRDWMGHRTNGGPGKVLVLASDPGDVLEYSRRFGATDTEFVGVARPPGPDDAPQWADLATRCQGAGVRMVVLDNLYSYAPGKDVNSNADIGLALSRLDPLTDRGIAVLLVHHTPKDRRKTPAGAHSILAKARHAIALTADSMTVHGNTVPRTEYPVWRENGRVVGIGEAVVSTPKEKRPKKPHQKRADRAAQQREALAFLATLPERDWSGRGLAKLFIGRIDRIDSPGQGRELVEYLRREDALASLDLPTCEVAYTFAPLDAPRQRQLQATARIRHSLARHQAQERIARGNVHFSAGASAAARSIWGWLRDDPALKVLVIGESLDELAALEQRLSEWGIPSVTITGESSQNTRGDAIADFRDSRDVRVLIGSVVLQEGLNLQFCRILVSLGLPDNEAGVDQRQGRIVRPGSPFTTVRHEVILTDTPVDRGAVRRVQRKAGEADKLLDGAA